jgi:AcrR family transcriptional regulator
VARSIPPERFPQLIRAATEIFIARGYRLTQMVDISTALGIAKGTLYGYVESKEALFDAAVRYADGFESPPALSSLPLRTPPEGATLSYIRERIAKEAADMALVRVLKGDLVIRNARRELETVLTDLYRGIARNRFAVKLVDRCAADYPELARVWFGEGRWAQHRLLVDFIDTRAKNRRFRRIENTEVVARTVLETIAFWSLHRHFDPSSQSVDDAAAERAVVDFLAHAVLEKP